MKKSNSLIFFGNERLSSGFVPQGAPTLQALLDNGYTVKAVVANYDVGRSRNARPLEIADVAKAHGIPVLLPERPQDIMDRLKTYGAEVGVLVAYGRIIPQSIIGLFPKGILNIHPSLLPHYRGSAPIEQALLDGASETGVSIMQLVKEMDAGPIYAQRLFPLTGTETKQTLTERLLRLGAQLIIDVLPSVLDETARPTPQDESAATYTKRIDKADGIMDFTKSAQQLEREVRAYAVWPKSHVTLHNHQVVVTKAHVAQNENNGQLVVACHPGYLAIDELIAPSGKTMSGEAFLRGYATR